MGGKQRCGLHFWPCRQCCARCPGGRDRSQSTLPSCDEQQAEGARLCELCLSGRQLEAAAQGAGLPTAAFCIAKDAAVSMAQGMVPRLEPVLAPAAKVHNRPPAGICRTSGWSKPDAVAVATMSTIRSASPMRRRLLSHPAEARRGDRHEEPLWRLQKLDLDLVLRS